MSTGVRERNLPVGNACFGGQVCRDPADSHGRSSGGLTDDLDIGPGDAVSPAGADRFEDGFLGGKAGGQMLMSAITRGQGVGLLSGGEDTIEKMIPMPLNHLADAVGLNQINAMT